MLYRNSEQLESSYYVRRSADYAWQLTLAAASIIGLNLPLQSLIHTRPLLVALSYMTSRLAPPGAQTSLFGLVSIPLVYFPYALILLDLLMGGPRAAAQSVTGAVAGHLWWWLVWDTRRLHAFGRAPAFLRSWIGNSDGNPDGGSSGRSTGVHVIPPRRLREEGRSTGHRWGSGNRLGST
ncbi:hypothetical protein NLI96_g1119 [Meripilus lineatus]|uniref:Derlin n=1 Tax=Meripilus lineatus TaxID=2056292 RepID=A0AAD5VD41_9APHY|nr:hypothetical protein NLI96_g1119 [Physisporinus lineatus]